MNSPMITGLRGSGAMLPTPFRFGRVDYEAFEGLCLRLIEHGTAALVPCSAAGEAALLTLAEQHRLVATAVDAARGRVPILAAIGSNNPATAVELARSAEYAGASALLCAAPIYLKPAPAGVIAHFEAIHNAVRIPIILNDVPARTACPLSDVSVKRLSALRRVIGLADASSDIARVDRLRRRLGNHFSLLSACDATQSAFRAAGGHGCLSITANVAPALCAALHRAHDENRLADVMHLDHVLAPLHRALFLEPNPIPLKRALFRLGLIDDGLRLPMSPLKPATDRRLAVVLAQIQPAERDEALRFAAARPLNPPRAA